MRIDQEESEQNAKDESSRQKENLRRKGTSYWIAQSRNFSPIVSFVTYLFQRAYVLPLPPGWHGRIRFDLPQ